MTAALTASPNPATPSSTVVASGTGFTDAVKTRLVLGNKTMTGQFYTTSGAFNVPIQIPSTSRVTQTLLGQQKPGKAWTFVAGVTLIVQSTPPAPKMVGTPIVDAITTTTATITWTLDQPSTGQVEYGPVSSPQTYPFLTTLEPNYYLTHSQDLTGLAAGTFYAFRVLSGNASGSITPVSRTFGTLAAAATVPGAPTGLTAVGGDTTVDLAWVTPASNGGSAITGYQILRAAVLIATVGVVNTFHDVGRTNGVSYSYTVKAVNAVGDSVASGSASATPAGSALVFPPDRNPVIFKAETVPGIPAIGTPLVDPDWNTHVRRLGAANSFRQLYARHQVENSDASLILMGYYHQPGGSQLPRLLDGTTYADLGAFPGGSGLINMALWSNLDPNKLFGVEGNMLRSQNATTGARTTLHTFGGYSSVSLGEYEGGISDDDKYVALIGNPGGTEHLIVYRIDTDTVIADIAAGVSFSDCQISRLGNYVTAATSAGIRRYTQNLSSYITLQSAYSHGDNALDASGNEIFVVNNDNGSPQAVAKFLLSSGAKTILLSGPQAFEYGHPSGHHNLNGWVGLSVYDEIATAGRKGCDQVALLKTDGSGTCRVFGHIRHLYDNSNPDKRYTNEPQATFSRDATRAFFTTNWRDASSWGYPFVAYA